MTFFPVSAREAREASRQSWTYTWRWITVGIGIVVLGLVGLANYRSRTLGNELFVAISTVAYINCLLAGVVRTADCIAAEKRDNTLGLLFLTDLRGWDILAGKLLTTSVNCFFGLLALFPLLAIPMLMGGVTRGEFIRVVLSLCNALFLAVSWGLLISTLFRRNVVTISMGLLTMFFIALAMPFLTITTLREYGLEEYVNLAGAFSPTHSLITAFAPSAPGLTNHYWLSLFINHAFAWLNLGLAVYFLPRFWQETPKSRKWERWHERFRALRFGKGRRKNRFRERLLNQNPLFWLSGREQVSSLGLMTFSTIVLLGSVAVAIGTRTGDIFALWFGGLIIVHLTIAFRVAMSATNRLAEDRRSGALELLLGTELSVKEVLRGHWMALRRQFFGPALIVVFGGVSVLAMLLVLSGDNLKFNILDTFYQTYSRLVTEGIRTTEDLILCLLTSAQIIMILNWIPLIWTGMWFGLREKHTGLAIWATLAVVFLPPWFLLAVSAIVAEESGLLSHIPSEKAFRLTFAAGWVLALTHIVLLSLWARRNLLRRFREAAVDRFMISKRIPIQKVCRIALRFAAVVAGVYLLHLAVRTQIDREGEKLWRAALTNYPQFSLKTEEKPIAVVSDAQNFARTRLIERMISSGPTSSRWGTASRIAWNWAHSRKANLPTIEAYYLSRSYLTNALETSAATVLARLDILNNDLEELHNEAKLRPFTQFAPWSLPSVPPNYYIPQSTTDPSAGLRNMVSVLAIRSSARHAQGTAALDDILLGHRIVEGLKERPGNIMKYHEMLLDLTQPIYDGLALRIWNNNQLKQIQEHYTSINLWNGYQVFQDDWVRQTLGMYERVIQGRRGTGPSDERWLPRQMPTGPIRKRQAQFLKWSYDELPKAVDIKARQIQPALVQDFLLNLNDLRMTAMNPHVFLATLSSLGFVQTTIDQIIVACALERFRNSNGAYPEHLEELVPEYLASVPKDIFTGKPLHYRLDSTKRHYKIYSTGPDGSDDEGTQAPVSDSSAFWRITIGPGRRNPQIGPTGGDWVWNSDAQEPAKPPKPPPPKAPRRM